jgi:pyruvate dehydrogenase E1 component beta subunit
MYGVSFEVSDACMKDDFIIPLGKAKVERVGKISFTLRLYLGTDVTIVAHSKCVGQSLEAAAELEKKGISAEVINLRTIRPLDIDTIVASVKKTGRIVSVEGGWSMYGVGSEIAAQIMESMINLKLSSN